MQPGEVFLHLCVAAGVTQLRFQFIQGGFAMLDGVPHTLAGNAEILGNLGKGKILVIIFGKDGTLLFGKGRAVEVQQHRIRQVFLRFSRHDLCPPLLCLHCVKRFSLHQPMNYNSWERGSQEVLRIFLHIQVILR